MYGFRKGCSTRLVTEALRQSLHLAVTWDRALYIISLDIATAFDDMQHDQITDSLLSLGIHPLLVHALLREYCQLKARVKIADADFSNFFSFRKGGRQGGVETPEVFNLMVESAAAAVSVRWKEKNYGFTVDDKAYISHLAWADNFFLLA
eukprot:10732218-Karenia_brevis.AAC.1